MTHTAPASALVAAAPDARSLRDALGQVRDRSRVRHCGARRRAHRLDRQLTHVRLPHATLISFRPARSSLTWSRMRHARRFAVNVLGRHHERFAMRATPAGTDRFAGLDWQPGHGGIPLLTDALATLECEIVAEHPTGDHWIVVGRVDNLRTSPITDPLVFFAGALGALK
jgi:hypothetical protein